MAGSHAREPSGACRGPIGPRILPLLAARTRAATRVARRAARRAPKAAKSPARATARRAIDGSSMGWRVGEVGAVPMSCPGPGPDCGGKAPGGPWSDSNLGGARASRNKQCISPSTACTAPQGWASPVRPRTELPTIWSHPCLLHRGSAHSGDVAGSSVAPARGQARSPAPGAWMPSRPSKWTLCSIPL